MRLEVSVSLAGVHPLYISYALTQYIVKSDLLIFLSQLMVRIFFLFDECPDRFIYAY